MKSDASCIEQYIEQWCGWTTDANESDSDIESYFTQANFDAMFGCVGEDFGIDSRWTFSELASQAISMRDELKLID